MEFESINFHPAVMDGIRSAGYKEPTPIQAKAIPPVMEGRDVMGLAQTGTGKTAAFALPILNRLMAGPRGKIRALIIAPTRELAEQIHDSFNELGRRTGLRCATVYGGVGYGPQMKNLRRGTEIVVACPGRLLDHLNQGNINLSHLEFLVLDEADHMFDMGFLPDIRKIIKKIPDSRQTLLFSATMPKEIRALVNDTLSDPVTVQIGMTAPAETVRHALYPVASHLKTDLLLKLLHQTETESVLVFTRTKHRAKRLGEKLARSGYKAASIQGNLSQTKRQEAMNGFRKGRYKILVATDIAARGIDVTKVSHVINFDIPNTPDAYIHRIGRTGRAARNGDAFTLITREDRNMVRAIDRVLGSKIERRTLSDFDYGGESTAWATDAERRPRPNDPARPGTRNRNGRPDGPADRNRKDGAPEKYKSKKSTGKGRAKKRPVSDGPHGKISRDGRKARRMEAAG